MRMRMGKNGWTAEQLKAKDGAVVENHVLNGHTEPIYRVMHGAGAYDQRPIYVSYTVGLPSKGFLEMRQKDTRGSVKVIKVFP
jgi:hypothetical protein